MRLLTLLVCTVLCGVAAAQPAPGEKPQPNVLFVFTDDQRFDTIRALGNTEIHTRTLDALVKRGFTFTNAYCQGSMIPAVCAPSRTMLLTGKSLFRIPQPNAKKYAGPTLGGVFRKAGYATLCVSKPGNSFQTAHRDFETVVHLPHQGAPTSRKSADAVLTFLEKHPAGKPYFIYLAPAMPHDPRTAEEEFHKLYDPAKITLSKNFLPEHSFDNGELLIRDEKLAPFPRTEAEMRRHLADYYACITGLDHHIGRVIASITQRGELENTIIVFTSDQGLAVGGRHGLMGKQNLYEHVKPPLVVAGPGIPHGQSPALAYLFDLFPTVCDLTGVPTPKACEGRSLAPVMRGEMPRVREHLFAAYKNVQRMVRDDRWKLLWYPKIDRVQLFDLQTDPDELHDLSAKPEYADRLKAMRALMAQQQTNWADTAPRIQP